MSWQQDSGGKRILLSFDAFEFDVAEGAVWRSGRRIDVDGRPLAVLAKLLDSPERVVSREALRSSVWRGVVVSDAAIASAVRDLRRALGDSGSDQRLIQTVRNRGFRIAAPVERREIGATADSFLGHEAAMRRMEGILEDAGSSGGRWLWIAGEPGIGKTRALVELTGRLARRGIPLHFGSCLEEPGASPYRPWQQILRSLVGRASPKEIDDRFGRLAARALSLLPEWGPAIPDAGSSSDGSVRLLVFDGVVDLLRRAAGDQPLVLALDDLHRADAPTAKLAQHVIHELPRLSLAVIGAYRPEEVSGGGHPLAPALAGSQAGVERLDLPGLDVDETRRLAGAILGAPLSADTGEALWTRTKGNPLFVREIARALGESEDGGEPDRRAVEAVVPSGFAQFVEGRVSRLAPGAVRSLECAAVIGREFDRDVLRAVLSTEPSAPSEDDLETALAAGLVEAVAGEPGRLRFTHMLVRDGVYANIPPLHRSALHGRVGLAIERLRAHAEADVVSALAHHFGEAAADGEARRAYTYATRAGEIAFACSAWEEAERSFEMALRAMDLSAGPADAGARAACWVRLGQSRWRSGAPEAAREAFSRAADIAEEIGEAETLATAAAGFAGRTDAEPRVNPQSVALLERALAALPEEASPQRCEVLARLGTEFYYGDRDRCETLTERALTMAEELGDRDSLAYALSARGFALMRPDVAPLRRIAIYDRQIALVESRGEVAALGLQEKLIALLEQGDALGFDEGLRALRRLADELRQPFFAWMVGVFESAQLLRDGFVGDAVGRAEATFRLGCEFATPNAIPMFSVQLIYMRREQGRISELEPALRTLLSGEESYPGFRSGLPAMLLERGRKQEARSLLDQILFSDVDQMPRDQHWIPYLAMLADSCARLGEASWAQRLHDLLSPFAGRIVVVGHGAAGDGSVDHHLARLAAAAGDLELADEHFAAALPLEQRAGARLYAAHTQRQWAGVLWKLGAPHEREQARVLEAEAAATYRSLDLERGPRF